MKYQQQENEIDTEASIESSEINQAKAKLPKTNEENDEGIASENSTSEDSAFDKREILHSIWILAVPTFGQLIAEPAFVLIDTAIIGHIGRTALAGLSIGSTVLLTIAGLCLFLAYNTTSQVARLLGSGKKREGFSIGMDGLWLALFLGVVLTALLMIAAEPLCYAIGARGETLQNAIVYTQTVMPGLPAMLLIYAANGIFRGLRKVRITLFAAVSGAIVNTVLDLIMVFALKWGIAGSGIATMIAQWYMGLVLVVPAVFWAAKSGARLRTNFHHILHSAGSGMPLFVRTLALRVCMVATVVTATRLGTNTLAAYQVANSCWNFVMNILDAIGIAAQTIVATALGANLRMRARTITRMCASVGALSSVVVGIFMIAIGWTCAPLFSNHPYVQLLISVSMTILGIFLPLSGWMWALDGVLIGAGDHRYLAKACSIMAIVYIATLVCTGLTDITFGVNDVVRTITLWLALNVVYIGGRAVGNSLRIGTDEWMESAKHI